MSREPFDVLERTLMSSELDWCDMLGVIPNQNSYVRQVHSYPEEGTVLIDCRSQIRLVEFLSRISRIGRQVQSKIQKKVQFRAECRSQRCHH